jgi:hypothetical protein
MALALAENAETTVLAAAAMVPTTVTHAKMVAAAMAPETIAVEKGATLRLPLPLEIVNMGIAGAVIVPELLGRMKIH